MATKPKLALKDPLPAHKALRNLEKAYGEKCKELETALARIAELEKEREYRIS